MNDTFRRTFIIGASLIAGGFLIFTIFVYFVSGAITAEAEKISQNRDVIRNHSSLIEGLAKQKASSQEVKKFEQAINLILPPKDELVGLSDWLDGLSRAHNVGVSFNFSGDAVPAKDSDAGYIKFTMNASGSYSNIADFLRDVELKAPRYTISFDDFDLKKNGNN